MKGIVTLCGSTKFKEQFEEVNRRLTWSGWVVLSVGSFHHSEKDHDIAGQIIARKVKLDRLHKEKIAMSQAVVVINVGGYIGDSTHSEIAHAELLLKDIYWLELKEEERPHVAAMGRRNGDFSGNPSWERLLDESPDDLKPNGKESA